MHDYEHDYEHDCEHDYETVLYREEHRVAWVTLNRPDSNNAFNSVMQAELKAIWQSLRKNPDVGCVVLTGAGDTAFCTGIDRSEVTWEGFEDPSRRPEGMPGFGLNPFTYDSVDPNIGPKENGLWTPVIIAANGMACGGAFYLLGQAEFVIAADHATFFDPHITYGMTSAFESIHLLQKMPFQEIMRIALMGGYERMSAERAREIGLVSEVVGADALHDTAAWAAERIASQPPLAVTATVRALWMGLELSRQQALGLAPLVLRIGSDRETLVAGQAAFTDHQRPEYRTR